PDETPPGTPGSALLSRGWRKPREAADARQVDAVQHHLQLAGAQLNGAGVGWGLGEVVAAGFEALAPQAQAVTAPVEDFEPVGGTVPEDEQVAGQGVGVQAVFDQAEQAVEAQAHIDRVRAVPQLDGGRHGQHGRSPSVATSRRTKSRSQPEARRRTPPPRMRSSTRAAAGGGRAGARRASGPGGGGRRGGGWGGGRRQGGRRGRERG